MKLSRKFTLLLLFSSGIGSLCSGADSVVVFIEGFVYDTSGSPIRDATVLLQNSGLSAITNRLGACTIYKKIPVILPIRYPAMHSALPVRPALKPDGLYFSIRGSAQQVTVTLFSLSGRKAKDIVNSNLAPGNYRLGLPGVASSQPYILRARTGSQVFYFKVSLYGVSSAIGGASVTRLDEKSLTEALSKKAVFQDKIIVSAAAYDTMIRPLDSTDGAHYFYLGQAGSISGKRLDITFTFNEIQNPIPSYLTAVWLEDSAKTRLRTMFVSQWLSFEGYRRPGICPDWLGPDSTYWATERTTDTSLVDAVTHATPIKGKNSINTLLDVVQNPVRCCLETHIDGQTNIMYSAALNPQLDSSETRGTVTYVPSRVADPDALSDVTFKLHK